MNQSQQRNLVILVIIAILGLIIAFVLEYPFLGGLVTGASSMLLLTATVGIKLARRAADKIDKQISIQKNVKNNLDLN